MLSGIIHITILSILFQRNPYVIVTNLAFGALSIFHLAYLGLMFDSSDDEEKVIAKFCCLAKCFTYM